MYRTVICTFVVRTGIDLSVGYLLKLFNSKVSTVELHFVLIVFVNAGMCSMLPCSILEPLECVGIAPKGHNRAFYLPTLVPEAIST